MFTFPKFDVVFVAFGEGREGAIAQTSPPIDMSYWAVDTTPAIFI
jgi:hypothetical protein